jgi:hypothetical protein
MLQPNVTPNAAAELLTIYLHKGSAEREYSNAGQWRKMRPISNVRKGEVTPGGVIMGWNGQEPKSVQRLSETAKKRSLV